MGFLDALGLRFADPTSEAIHGQATRFGITACDAAYVALAEELEVEMWTGDRRLHRAVAGNTDRVRWIGDWGAAPAPPTGGTE